MADPNSRHQLWAKWTIAVHPPSGFAPTYATVQQNVARFVRKGFGSCGEMSITRKGRTWLVAFLVEAQRHPQDRDTFLYFSRAFTTFFREAFGARTEVDVKAKLMAGARLDGAPPDQLVMLPRLEFPRASRALGVL